MEQGDKHRLLKGPVLFLLILILLVAAFLLAVSLYKSSNNEQTVVNPSPNPNSSVGSVSENVESIQIDLLPVNTIPEFNVGGTITGILTLIGSFAIFVVRKKRSKIKS